MFEQFTLSTVPESDEAIRGYLRRMVREAVASMSTAQRARTWQGFSAEFSRQLGKAGYLGLTVPQTYGGQGKGPFTRFVVVEELLTAGAPVAAHWIADRQSAPLLLDC